MKARSFTILLTALLVVLCTGCGIHINTGKELTFDDTIHYSTYENAADYAAGSSIYQAEEVHAVRVYWIAGEISVTEKDTDTLSVSDAAGDRSQEAQLHSLLRDGVLTIHYCASDFRGELKPEWKLLTLEIPHGIELTIESVSAPIYATALTTPQLHIATVSGDVSIGSITGDNLRIDTVSGEFDVDTAEVKTVTMNSVSGDFDLERITVDQLTADTVSGNVGLELASCREAKIETVSGKTDITIPAAGATVRYETAGGDLITTRTSQRQGDYYGFGSSACKIAVSSVSGDLEIK